MNCTARFFPYSDTLQFSTLVLDYLNQRETLKPFYAHFPNPEGFKNAVTERKKSNTDRKALYEALSLTHAGKTLTAAQQKNLDALQQENTFTVCTAHQPNIFSGYLYFIYKTLHAITLAETLNQQMPESHFVPVFYIGSEDNDFDELSQLNLDGQKLRWETNQTGAVGRMKVDKGLLALILQMEGRLGVEPFGAEIIHILKDSYAAGLNITEATFRLLNHFFAEYGLLILQPDQPALKRQMISVFKEDLLKQLPYALVEKTVQDLSKNYKVQVNPREINLFYLEADSRQRISLSNGIYSIEGSHKKFTEAEILQELENHPEKFSPNVVLRGIFQETILPNIAFIGGGSETAYWLELKNMFDFFKVPFPVLVLRNSFLLLSPEQESRLQKSGWRVEDLFISDFDLMNQLVKNQSKHKLSLDNERSAAAQFYAKLNDQATAIDPTLNQHVASLEKRALSYLDNLEKKMLRAEKRKFEAEHRQLQKLKADLFPKNGLQERVENILLYYARYGKGVIECIYRHSPAMDMKFGIISMTP